MTADHFTRVIRADPTQAGLLYAGTERGLYLSGDDGASWQAFQLNLPIVPITDLAIKEGNLVAATQGRGYWILDPLNVVRQLAAGQAPEDDGLFLPAPAWRVANEASDDPGQAGTSAPAGVVFHYQLANDLDEDSPLELLITDSSGATVRRFTRKPAAGAAAADEDDASQYGDDDRLLESSAGLHDFTWNLRYPSVETFDGLVLWNRNLEGPQALPGVYQATLTAGGMTQTVPVEVLADPRVVVDDAALAEQFEFVLGINQKLTETHRAIRQIRALQQSINLVEERAGDSVQFEALLASGNALKSRLEAIEETLYQTKLESPQDPLNYPDQTQRQAGRRHECGRFWRPPADCSGNSGA